MDAAPGGRDFHPCHLRVLVPLTCRFPQQARDLIRNWHVSGWTPMRRLGTPEDVGTAAALLCSERPSWITGQVIYADGGASLMNPEVPPEIQLG